MGRKSDKGKERKQKWKEEQKKVAGSFTKVKAAQELADPLALILPFKKFQRNGLDLQIEFCRRKELSKELFEWAFELLEKNMKSHYETSEGSWKARVKRDELDEEEAYYLIARHAGDSSPVAFVHFRFDLDDDDEVLYCYEIQLDDSVQGKGLGRHLMQVLELISFRTSMKRVVLTVFPKNKQAYSFFQKLKYANDDTCPSWDGGVVDGEHVSYEILRKATAPKAAKEVVAKGPAAVDAASAAPLAAQPNGCTH